MAPWVGQRDSRWAVVGSHHGGEGEDGEQEQLEAERRCENNMEWGIQSSFLCLMPPLPRSPLPYFHLTAFSAFPAQLPSLCLADSFNGNPGRAGAMSQH